MSYLRDALSIDKTPQNEPIPGLEDTQVANNAGGYVFKVDDWTRLERFLILGSDKGTYYVNQNKLTLGNAKAVLRCIANDGQRVVAFTREISVSGRAPKNDQAIFVLALCLTHGDLETKRVATAAVNDICRIGTHLFQLVGYIDSWHKWNRTTRRAVSNWYGQRSTSNLARQMVKYQNREGWSHHDVMHMAHVHFSEFQAASKPKQVLADWAKNGWPSIGVEPHPEPGLDHVWAFERAKLPTTTNYELRKLIAEYGLTRESVPTTALNDPLIWTALLRGEQDETGAVYGMPLTAMIRNLGKMTNVGVFTDPTNTDFVVEKLNNKEALQRARIHPLSVLLAMKVYQQGHGDKGSLAWSPVRQIVNALDSAFYLTFQNVVSTNKRRLIALDVSGSMEMSQIAGTCITPRVGSAAMALITLATEPNVDVVAFASQGWALQVRNTDRSMFGRSFDRGVGGIAEINISNRQRLDDVVKYISSIPMGGTDCALPMLWAAHEKRRYESFEIYTDNETWAGSIHPTQALAAYRKQTGIPAKLTVVGMTATEFSIADPDDAGSLDVVGFDAAAPTIIADFIRS